MKNLLMSAACLLALSSLAQKEPVESIQSGDRPHEIGISVTGLLEAVAPKTNFTSSYLLFYKKHLNKGAFRFGFDPGIFFRDRNTDNGVTTGLDDTRTKDLSVSSIFTTGYEWPFHVAKRWDLYLFLDGLYGVGYGQSETTRKGLNPIDSESRVLRVDLGVTPGMGIRFFPTSRLSIGLDFNYQVTGAYEVEKEWQNGVVTQLEKSWTFIDRLPTPSLYLSFRL